MPSGCKGVLFLTAERRNLCQNNRQIKVKCDQKFTARDWTNPLILGKTGIVHFRLDYQYCEENQYTFLKHFNFAFFFFN